MISHKPFRVLIAAAFVVTAAACMTLLAMGRPVAPGAEERLVLRHPMFATKVRHNTSWADGQQQDELIAFCLEYGINRLIVRVQSQTTHEDTERPAVQQPNETAKLIAKAAGHAIEVEALVGDDKTGLAENHPTALAHVDAILAWNQTLPPGARLTGLHYEIDPSTLNQWETRRRPDVMQQWLDLLMVVGTRLRQNPTPVLLSASIPEWYDQRVEVQDHCLVEYYGQHKNFHEHIQDLTDYVVVTCRRHHSPSDHTLHEQAQAELSYAQWIDRSVSLGLETGRLEQTPHLSYYGRPAWEFWLQKKEAEQALDGRPGFTGVVVNGYVPLRQLVSSQDPTQESKPAHGIFGMWVWDEQWIKNDAQHDRLLAFCETYGINLLSVQIHVDPGSVIRGQPSLRYPTQLRRLVEKARRRKIRVEALDGAPEMALAQNRPVVLAILDAILALNRTLPPSGGFTGIHYDIEPYLLELWNTPARSQIMRDYLQVLEAAALKLKLDAPDLTLSASIPFWYDQKIAPGDNCVLEYNGQEKNLHEHIQDLTDYVAVMSYRRQALGPDSITQHVEAERAYAEWAGRFVFAGLETMEIPDQPDVTFHGLPPSEFWFQKQKLDQALGNRGGFGGVVVHSYGTFSRYLAGQD